MKTQIIAALFGLAVALPGAAQTVDSVLTNRLAEPYNVAVELGAYYISDSANDRIIKYAPDTGAMSTLAGFAGRPGAVDAKGVYARFFNPRGLISVPARGGLIVADYANHTLRLVKLDGTVTTLAGTAGAPGYELGPTPAAGAHFNFPSGLAADTNGNVYIADSKNKAIRKLDLANFVTTLASDLNEPNGLALGDNGDLWFSESRDYTIKRLTAGGVVVPVVGISGQSGAVDSIFGNEALFNNPTAVLWIGQNNGLLVCDTGNHAVRRVFWDEEIGGYSVETYAGSLTQPGFVNGPLIQAKFNLPAGITRDPMGGFLVTDLGNSALRRIQISSPLPPVADPVIGYVAYQKDQWGELLSYLVPVSQAVFNNDETIAIRAEAGTETYFRADPTPADSLEGDQMTVDRSNDSAPRYRDGVHPDEVPPSLIGPRPDVTIKAIGTQDGRRPSAVVQARFQFKTANPAVVGDNAASFTVANVTLNAQMWYTIDGSEPTINGPTSTNVVNGPMSLPRSPTPITFKIRAFRESYKDSEIVTKVFSPEDFQANRMSFGFENGEGSSEFIASAGQTFFAPVTLSLLPSQKMYTLQFNVTVTNLASSPLVDGKKAGFQSMLEWNIDKDLYVTIPPALFLGGQSLPPELQRDHPGFGDLLATNSGVNLLAVGWLERAGATNLYDTIKQDLITYSIAHDTIFLSKDQKVIVGGYSFTVPTNALSGDTFKISLGRPSATSNGVNQDNYIEAITDGTLTATPVNRLNSIKHVTVGQRRYIVGDVAPFRWFNAGDFGEGLLLNNDVVQVFQSAVYRLNGPPEHSDFYDAMDSSDGVTNPVTLQNAPFGDDLLINEIKFGDGYLNVDDVYVTFRRSLDPSLTWYARHWENGKLQAVATDNVGRSAQSRPGQLLSFAAADLPAGSLIPGAPAAAFAVDDRVVGPGQVLQVPVRARITGELPLRVLMLNLTVEPLSGSPAMTYPVEFTPATGLGQATLTSSRGSQNFAGAWLNNQASGVAGATVVGYLKVTIPADAPSTAAYRVHFDHASGSPNGIGLFPKQVQDGVLSLRDVSGSSVGDGIPDLWRLRYFGAVSNAMALANVDADGDGLPNWAEFNSGTNPIDATSRLRLVAHRQVTAGTGPHALTLRWSSAPNKNYTIEAAPSLQSDPWNVLSSGLLGTGDELQFTPPDQPAAAQFFRVRVSE